MQVERQDEGDERALAIPLAEDGFDTEFIAGAVAIATVDDGAIVRPDGLVQTVLANVLFEAPERLFSHQREDRRDRMEFHHRPPFAILAIFWTRASQSAVAPMILPSAAALRAAARIASRQPGWARS